MSNSRVTNAKILDKVEELQADISAYRIHQEKRIVYLETCMEMIVKKADDLDDKVDGLQKKSNLLDGVTGTIAAIGTLIGMAK